MARPNLAARAAHWSSKHRRKAILGWLACVVVGLVLVTQLGIEQIPEEDLGSGDSKKADQLLADRFPDRVGEEVLFQGRGEVTARDPRFREAVREVDRGLGRFDYVQEIESPLAPGNRSQFSKDGRSALLTFEIRGDEDQAEEDVTDVLAAVARVQAAHPELRVEEFGGASAGKALSERFEDDFQRAETLSVPITLVILFLAFGALVAAGVPLLLGISAVIITLGLVALISGVLPFSESIFSVILLIGLAVGVDYSLFYIRREREERAEGRSEHGALMAAAATSGRAVLISGCTVMIAMAGLYITGSAEFMSFGTGTILVVAVAMIGSLTVLPAVLSKLGDRIEKGHVPGLHRLRKEEHGESGLWSAIVERVLHRPLLWAVLATALLVVLALPAFRMHTVSSGVQGLPQDLPIVQTYDRIQAAFPGNPLPADVVVTAPNVESPAMRTALARIRSRAIASGGFREPVTISINPDKTVAAMSIPIAGNGTDDTSDAALARMRDEVIPASLEPVPEAEAFVTGITAESVDFNDLMSSRAPLVFLFVLGLAFVLLLVTFRSIVIPIKAIVLNLLSVGAAYGVLVWIFQDGNLEGLFGFESIDGIVSWLPLFLFVLLFGLSMDYHVFILTRVREAFDRGMSTDAAVAHGIKSTAGVVTAAAVVMVGVFGIFATLSMVDFKQMGIGLATAVLIDATIIRGVLLPASMKLLGDWNWYLPKWLEGLPQIAPEPAVGASVPAAAVVPTGEPSFGIDVERRNGDVRLALRGELDCDTCTALRDQLEELEAEQPDLLLIDLRGLSFMDSSGLRELVAAVRRGREEGRRVVLVKGSAPVDSVLAITRAEDAMETVEDPAAAGFGDLRRDG
jgi:RND superfamily putative drug exporter